MDQQRFLQQLQIVLDPTKGSVKEATGTLKKEFYTHPESLLFLIQVATSHDDQNLRQLAAVESRTLVYKHWLKIAAEQKPQVREQLLRAALGEGTSLVRHSCARIISAIAKIDIEDGQWADLPGFLLQAAASPKADERATGIYILFTILETLGEGFQEKFSDLFALFEKTIRDPESAEVRINTLLALSKLAIHLDSEEDEAPVKAFQNIFPAMVAVLKDSIDRSDEDRILQAFEVFQTLLACDPQLMNPHLRDLVLFMNQLAANTELDEDTRTQAISFLMQATRYRKLRIQGMQIGSQITLTCLQIATELGDTAVDDDDITPARSALGLLDMLAQSLPPSQIVVPLLNALGQYFNNKDPDYRRAGIMALGMCVEGAPDFISTQMKEIFPVVFQLLSDPESKVRQATLHGVARIAESLAEDIGQHHQQMMPLLLTNLRSTMQEWKGEESGPAIDNMKAAISALDAVVDALGESDVILYQGEVVPILHELIKHPDFKVKALTASALGSIASSAGEAFLPFFNDSMHLMQDYATMKDSEDELELRACVTDAMGEMSASAGPEHFKNYVEPLMRASEEALQLGHSRLKESTYLFWGSMSRVYGEDFTPFLDGIVKGLFACLDQEETDLEVELGEAAKDLIGQEVTIAGRKVRVAGGDDDDQDVSTLDDSNIEDVDIDGEDDWEDLTTVGPLALEKEIAVEVIGDIITHAKKAYLPYFEKTIEQILPLCEHPYEGIRRSTISTLHRAYAALWQVCEESGQMQKWVPGKGMDMIEPPAELKKLTEILVTATIKMWSDEEDRETVADINRNVAENLKYCGPYLVSDASILDNVVTMVTTIITKQHPAQQDYGADEEDRAALEELSEYDWVVIDTALDVISGLAIALGGNFLGLWPHFEKTVLQYVGSSEPLERSTATGVLAEIIFGLADAITPLTTKFLELLLRRLSDEDSQTKSNAAYAIGRLVERSNSDQEIIQAYPTILEKLEPCLHIPEARLPDNASGCLSRMILKHRDNVPVADVLSALVDLLPLKNDYEENDPVYRMICQLYKWEDPTVRSLTPRLIPIFEAVLTGDSDQLDDERRAELIELVSWLNKMQPGVASWVGQLGQ
ncbi:importin beta-4 subunit [Blastomyces gilchristii SLH14081]|uniref:Importin beta-4 subunit n=1 Tax=Blastomyces gilchristii (strain SLH14081) TaxID=559298 RepID=A0A179UGZ6_BLAGS|nr:importin beta-4 subunit [Blastomyces gilchristii SLH14081]OAT05782.1 importin beta-4 subunit [Blastomyces gilchristii SLH14081]